MKLNPLNFDKLLGVRAGLISSDPLLPHMAQLWLEISEGTGGIIEDATERDYVLWEQA